MRCFSSSSFWGQYLYVVQLVTMLFNPPPPVFIIWLRCFNTVLPYYHFICGKVAYLRGFISKQSHQYSGLTLCMLLLTVYYVVLSGTQLSYILHLPITYEKVNPYKYLTNNTFRYFADCWTYWYCSLYSKCCHWWWAFIIIFSFMYGRFTGGHKPPEVGGTYCTDIWDTDREASSVSTPLLILLHFHFLIHLQFISPFLLDLLQL